MVIKGIQAGLNKRYRMYRFNVICNPTTKTYSITAFKGTNNAGTSSYSCFMPITDFWAEVQAWMLPILKVYGI
jgi:hypothetical protein